MKKIHTQKNQIDCASDPLWCREGISHHTFKPLVINLPISLETLPAPILGWKFHRQYPSPLLITLPLQEVCHSWICEILPGRPAEDCFISFLILKEPQPASPRQQVAQLCTVQNVSMCHMTQECTTYSVPDVTPLFEFQKNSRISTIHSANALKQLII